MKRRTGLIFGVLLVLLPIQVSSQDCNILSKANNINPDQFCSPVEVVTWDVTYVGVNNVGANVQIHFDWDDGDTETLNASEGPVGTFTITSSHIYTSEGDKCNYGPVATLIVDGDMCESSSQEQIVTIWDNDDTNGGNVNASPNVFPICIGSGATMQFNDATLFNCVPPQENDVPNTATRWIQWVYGTSNSMSGTDVLVDGVVRTYPFVGPVIELTGPVTGSSEKSLPITVANDNLIDQVFEVELRYWNFCNPWPADPPVTDRSVIRIVDLPDATIYEVDTVCQYQTHLNLNAVDGGGSWSGNGIVNSSTGEFSPSVAGVGNHLITYQITDGNSCSSVDTEEIVVRPAPNGIISPVDPFCIYDAPYDLTAATATGTWTGTGITNAATGMFDPAVSGLGIHEIVFNTTTDKNGCFGTDTALLAVMDPPFAEFLTLDSSWCQALDNKSYGDILISGTDSTTYDLVMDVKGVRDTLKNLTSGTFSIFLDNEPGLNQYSLVKVIEHHGGNSCDTDLFDTLSMQVFPEPEMILNLNYDDLCSPVDLDFETIEGYYKYTWDFGDGQKKVTPTNEVSHSYQYDHRDEIMSIIGEDTIFGALKTDTLFYIQLIAETEFGCADTLNDSVRVYPNPMAGFSVNPQIQYYPDSVVYLVNMTSPGNWSYNWDFGDSTSDTLKDPGQHIFDTWGFFDIQLTSFSPYCIDTVTTQVQILPPSPQALFQPDSIGCPPMDINFRNSTLYADTYLWDFDDGFYSTDYSPTHRFWESKDHHVKLFATGPSGTDTIEHLVRIHERPTAMFEVLPADAKNLKQVFKFLNSAINSSYFLWDFGDGNTSPDENPSHIYSNAGTFSVSLYAWSEHDCTDTLVRHQLINILAGEGSTEFPNVFRWNESGPTGGHWTEGTIDNTVFHPNIINATELKMIIYNRWGQMLWETNEVYIGWDGYLKSGELSHQGVYVYKAWVTYVDGRQELLTGDVTFLH